MGIWSRTYVCCAVPLYNAGIYAIMAQFLIIAVVAGVLCFAAPAIVSVTTPSFVSYILGVLSFAVAACQPFGFFGVFREKPRLFKSYLRLNGLLVTASILLALAVIIISAVKHSEGVDQCTRLFSADDTDTTANDICNIWTWIQIGIMGLLFVIVGLCEIYFICYTSIYASEQRLDHARYDSVYSNAAEEIRQSGLWDQASRPSYSQDELIAPGYPSAAGHGRNASKSSGLRNEIARAEEYDDEYYEGPRGGAGAYQDAYAYPQQQYQQQPQTAVGAKLAKAKRGGAGSAAPYNATSVVGYRDEEEGLYDYPGGEGGFRPPQQSSETRRW
ncbi:uncharacterized protein JCM10292_007327 [Rhodotorula paludigena]|uniref:uncharacterized protein n=1 Tax=Rhodotorula paludigena TaxID=86838 RepID=UPI00316E57C7